MAYEEFTCDELSGMTLETLFRGSLVQQPDGSWAQQVVIVTAGGDFNDDFNDDFNI